MSALWLSRARLRRDAGLAALGPVLLPEGQDARADMAHRLVWTMFADSPDRRRDFLYREERPGDFITLSSRMPDGAGALFDVESKPFAPVLEAGDRLQFRLRANPTVARSVAIGRSGRDDVVMAALRHVPGDERAAARAEIVQREGAAWLHRLGERDGFALNHAQADGYTLRKIPRAFGRPVQLAAMEIEGILTVRDPASMLARMAAGFGRGRAFGYGLMLIRRG